MNYNSGNGVSFFKILVSDSADYLPLPPAFAKKYLEKGKNKKQTLVLNPKSAVKWRVKYFKIEDKYYFMDGWIKFIKENRLQKGDFLVFWLLAASPKSIFQVFFYASNGCLKNPVGSAGAGNGNKRLVKEKTSKDDEVYEDDEEDGDDDESLQRVHKSFSKNKVHKSVMRVLKKSYHHRMPMTKSYWKANGLEVYDCVRMRTDDGQIWTVDVRNNYGRIKNPVLIRGWRAFWKGNKFTMGNSLQITHVEGNLLHVRVIKRKKGKTIKKK